MTFAPTEEQTAALAMFKSGGDMLINALAGTGKSTTAVLLARSSPNQRFQFTAFNNAIVADLGKRVPRNSTSDTLHRLANQGTGSRFQHRFSGSRESSTVQARLLGIGPIFITTPAGRKTIQPGFSASLCVQAVQEWCKTAAPTVDQQHFPLVEGIDAPLERSNNDLIRTQLLPHARDLARRLMDPTDKYPFNASLGFAGCVKSWQLYGAGDEANPSSPRIHCDVLVVDEVQDVAECMADVLERQTDCQRVMVGDPNQDINSWLRTVNMFDRLDWQQTPLTRSFRFGPALAELSNQCLSKIGSDLFLVGAGSDTGHVGSVDMPNCVLTRTNAQAIMEVLEAQRSGMTTHLVGNGTEVAAFARGAKELMNDGWSSHRDLRIFGSWNEVLAYVEADPSGSELALLVKLVEEFGVAVIIAALDNTIPADQADVVVTTTHKAKGLSWPTVKIAGDFAPPEKLSLPEWKILYVAASRAEEVLDVSECEALSMLVSGVDPVPTLF